MHLSWRRLQWLRTKRFIRRNKGPIGSLLAGLAVLCLFWLTRNNRACMDWFVEKVSAPWKRFFGELVEPLPFSAAELLLTLLVVWVLFWAGRTLYEHRVRHRQVIGRCLLQLSGLLVWIYAGFCVFWGVHYYSTGFSEKSGLAAAPVRVEELEAVTRWFAQGANRAGQQVKRDSEGRFVASTSQILAYGDQCYTEIVKQWPFLEGPHRSPKPAFYSIGMSLTGFTGYLFPFLGESTLNVDSPNVFLPVTVAHEMAHQRGVAPEQEANFLGIAACLSSKNPDYQYSGWLFGYLHLSNALYSADPEAWEEINESLAEGCRADLQWNSRYWDAFASPIKRIVQTGYSGFLQSYSQTLGMKSYGACVDLLVAYYGPLTDEKNL